MGNDLGRLVPSEMMKLGHPLLRMEFNKKFLERALIQYRMEAVEKEAKGPIVVCIDNSTSMAGAREVWSKAVALALCQIAVDQKRAFAVVHFNKQIQRTDMFVEDKKVDPAQLLESMAFFSGGGTNFDVPLSFAFATTTEKFKDKGKGKADIIFITDGECEISDDMVKKMDEAKKATGVKLYSICIGDHAQQLEEVSDHYTSLRDLADDQALKETVFSI
jgi:uncharacterized protein with von Willebrand factor type A (vWA) domain